MTKSGVPPKGSDLLNAIVSDRVPRGQRTAMNKIMKKPMETKTEWSERMKKARESKEKKRKNQKAYQKRKKKERKEKGLPEEEEVESVAEDEEFLTEKEQRFKEMLMRVFEKACGEDKLIKLTQKSDALKMTIVKLLLDFEKKEFEMRMRAKIPQGSNAPGFFFVVRGLEDMKKVNEAQASMKFLEQVIAPSEAVIDLESEDKDETNK